MSGKKKSYRHLKSDLDEVIDKLQDPSIDIDQAIKLHATAKKLLSELQEYLKETEIKIKKATYP